MENTRKNSSENRSIWYQKDYTKLESIFEAAVERSRKKKIIHYASDRLYSEDSKREMARESYKAVAWAEPLEAKDVHTEIINLSEDSKLIEMAPDYDTDKLMSLLKLSLLEDESGDQNQSSSQIEEKEDGALKLVDLDLNSEELSSPLEEDTEQEQDSIVDESESSLEDSFDLIAELFGDKKEISIAESQEELEKSKEEISPEAYEFINRYYQTRREVLSDLEHSPEAEEDLDEIEENAVLEEENAPASEEESLQASDESSLLIEPDIKSEDRLSLFNDVIVEDNTEQDESLEETKEPFSFLNEQIQDNFSIETEEPNEENEAKSIKELDAFIFDLSETSDFAKQKETISETKSSIEETSVELPEKTEEIAEESEAIETPQKEKVMAKASNTFTEIGEEKLEEPQISIQEEAVQAPEAKSTVIQTAKASPYEPPSSLYDKNLIVESVEEPGAIKNLEKDMQTTKTSFFLSCALLALYVLFAYPYFVNYDYIALILAIAGIFIAWNVKSRGLFVVCGVSLGIVIISMMVWVYQTQIHIQLLHYAWFLLIPLCLGTSYAYINSKRSYEALFNAARRKLQASTPVYTSAPAPAEESPEAESVILNVSETPEEAEADLLVGEQPSEETGLILKASSEKEEKANEVIELSSLFEPVEEAHQPIGLDDLKESEYTIYTEKDSPLAEEKEEQIDEKTKPLEEESAEEEPELLEDNISDEDTSASQGISNIDVEAILRSSSEPPVVHYFSFEHDNVPNWDYDSEEDDSVELDYDASLSDYLNLYDLDSDSKEEQGETTESKPESKLASDKSFSLEEKTAEDETENMPRLSDFITADDFGLSEEELKESVETEEESKVVFGEISEPNAEDPDEQSDSDDLFSDIVSTLKDQSADLTDEEIEPLEEKDKIIFNISKAQASFK